VGLAERHAALGATRGLLGGLLGNKFGVDFMEIPRPLLRWALFGPLLPDRYEFLHAFGHERPPNGATMGEYSRMPGFWKDSSKPLP
jgi:hypothetical protein